MKIPLPLLIIAVTVPVATWLGLGSQTPKTSTQGTLSTTLYSPLSTPLVFSPQAGQRYIYDFERKIVISGLEAENSEIVFRGEFYLDILEVNAKEFVALASEHIQGQKPSPVVLKIKSDSKAERIEIFSGSKAARTEESRQHESVVKDLLALLLFPLKSDTVGAFQARFEPMPAADGFLFWRKIKTQYMESGVKPELVSSLHLLKWSEALKFPQEIKGAETTRLGRGDFILSSEASYLIQFKKMSAMGQISKALLADLNEPQPLTLSPERGSMEEHPDYSKVNWPDLLKQLQSLDGMDSSEQLQVFGDLIKMLQKDPTKLNDLLALLRERGAVKLGANSPLFQTAVGALATLGTAEAQAALRDLYKDPENPASGKGSILGAFTTTQASLNEETSTFLADAMKGEVDRDLSQGAAYALGASLEKAQGAQAANAVQQLLDAWAQQSSGSDLNEQLAILDAMGNSGRKEFFPVLSSVVQSSRPLTLRNKAIFALRFMNFSEAQQVLVSSLSDADVSVRSTSVSAMKLATWSEIFRQPLENCAASDTNAQVRTACVEARNQGQQTVAQN